MTRTAFTALQRLNREAYAAHAAAKGSPAADDLLRIAHMTDALVDANAARVTA